ncbi:hypothetical protein [Pseudomonas fontis]|uniref:Uncharacterized protein n=1 Tax=Pseudomonas fontis TaxID=2942633 RepID=A0ABT5P0R2_9PSED|nr:hypothetical protein [Pseudomonas fontis]MDD0977518.1 hypothetical protein [Pseudomonas fontis]MDD0994047.1 hypothetical protein [Pseudomonas fontis]
MPLANATPSPLDALLSAHPDVLFMLNPAGADFYSVNFAGTQHRRFFSHARWQPSALRRHEVWLILAWAPDTQRISEFSTFRQTTDPVSRTRLINAVNTQFTHVRLGIPEGDGFCDEVAGPGLPLWADSSGGQANGAIGQVALIARICDPAFMPVFMAGEDKVFRHLAWRMPNRDLYDNDEDFRQATSLPGRGYANTWFALQVVDAEEDELLERVLIPFPPGMESWGNIALAVNQQLALVRVAFEVGVYRLLVKSAQHIVRWHIAPAAFAITERERMEAYFRCLSLRAVDDDKREQLIHQQYGQQHYGDLISTQQLRTVERMSPTECARELDMVAALRSPAELEQVSRSLLRCALPALQGKSTFELMPDILDGGLKPGEAARIPISEAAFTPMFWSFCHQSLALKGLTLACRKHQRTISRLENEREQKNGILVSIKRGESTLTRLQLQADIHALGALIADHQSQLSTLKQAEHEQHRELQLLERSAAREVGGSTPRGELIHAMHKAQELQLAKLMANPAGYIKDDFYTSLKNAYNAQQATPVDFHFDEPVGITFYRVVGTRTLSDGTAIDELQEVEEDVSFGDVLTGKVAIDPASANLRDNAWRFNPRQAREKIDFANHLEHANAEQALSAMVDAIKEDTLVAGVLRDGFRVNTEAALRKYRHQAMAQGDQAEFVACLGLALAALEQERSYQWSIPVLAQTQHEVPNLLLIRRAASAVTINDDALGWLVDVGEKAEGWGKLRPSYYGESGRRELYLGGEALARVCVEHMSLYDAWQFDKGAGHLCIVEQPLYLDRLHELTHLQLSHYKNPLVFKDLTGRVEDILLGVLCQSTKYSIEALILTRTEQAKPFIDRLLQMFSFGWSMLSFSLSTLGASKSVGALLALMIPSYAAVTSRAYLDYFVAQDALDYQLARTELVSSNLWYAVGQVGLIRKMGQRAVRVIHQAHPKPPPIPAPVHMEQIATTLWTFSKKLGIFKAISERAKTPSTRVAFGHVGQLFESKTLATLFAEHGAIAQILDGGLPAAAHDLRQQAPTDYFADLDQLISAYTQLEGSAYVARTAALERISSKLQHYLWLDATADLLPAEVALQQEVIGLGVTLLKHHARDLQRIYQALPTGDTPDVGAYFSARWVPIIAAGFAGFSRPDDRLDWLRLWDEEMLEARQTTSALMNASRTQLVREVVSRYS